MHDLLLPLIVAVVALVIIVSRTNAALVFFALCGGSVLVQFANNNMAYVNGHLNSKLLPHGYTVSKPYLEIVILLIAPVLVAVFARHNNGPAKWPIQLFPALATGILGVLLVVPLLSTSLQNSVTQSKLWSLLEQYQIPIVSLCVLVSLILLILNTYSHGSSHGSKKHHKV